MFSYIKSVSFVAVVAWVCIAVAGCGSKENVATPDKDITSKEKEGDTAANETRQDHFDFRSIPGAENCRIRWASWGSGNRRVDVTDQVRKQFESDSHIYCDHDGFNAVAGDPAVGTNKKLTIVMDIGSTTCWVNLPMNSSMDFEGKTGKFSPINSRDLSHDEVQRANLLFKQQKGDIGVVWARIYDHDNDMWIDGHDQAARVTTYELIKNPMVFVNQKGKRKKQPAALHALYSIRGQPVKVNFHHNASIGFDTKYLQPSTGWQLAHARAIENRGPTSKESSSTNTESGNDETRLAVPKEFSNATFPMTVQAGRTLQFDMKRLVENAVRFELVSGPDNLRLSKEGIIEWRPDVTLRGSTKSFRFVVKRTEGDPTAFEYSLIVAAGSPELVPGTKLPTILPEDFVAKTFPLTVQAGEMFEFDMQRLENGHEFELIDGPEGLSVSSSGVIQWSPSNDLAGSTKRAKLVARMEKGLPQAFEYAFVITKTPPKQIPGTRKPLDLPRQVVKTPGNKVEDHAESQTSVSPDKKVEFPTTIPAGVHFNYDFKRLVEGEKFSLIKGPRRFTMLPHGAADWSPIPGKHQIVFRAEQADKKSTVYEYSLVVEHGEARIIEGAPLPIPRDSNFVEDISTKEYVVFPTTVVCGATFHFDFKRIVEPGEFEMILGPSGFSISRDGVVNWAVPRGRGNEARGVAFKVRRAGVDSLYLYRFIYSASHRHATSAIDKDDANYQWFPTTEIFRKETQHDLSKWYGKGDFMLIEGPRDLEISQDGILTWTPDGHNQVVEFIFLRTDSEYNQQYNFVKVLVERKRKRRIRSSIGANGSNGGKPKVLECPEPAGWAMMPEGKTLIISNPNEAQLIYFDTEKEIESKRVELDFQPTSLAIQGETLYASSAGSSIVYALDALTGKIKKKISIGGLGVFQIVCHPKNELVFASTDEFDVFEIDFENETSRKTDAKGQFLAMDPSGEFLFSGIQPRNRRELVIEVTETETERVFEFHRDHYGTRASIFKYQLDGGLKLVDSQDNAAVNGKSMHLTPDGQRIMIAGGGWRPVDEGVGGGPETAIFDANNLKSRVGKVYGGIAIAFHPTLELGVSNDSGWQLVPFKSNSYIALPAIIVNDNLARDSRASLLTFASNGEKIILWNGEEATQQKGLHFIPLNLPDERRQKSQQ